MALFKEYRRKPETIKAFQVPCDGEVHMKQEDGSLLKLEVKAKSWVVELGKFDWLVYSDKEFRDMYIIPDPIPTPRVWPEAEPFVPLYPHPGDWSKKRDIHNPWDNPWDNPNIIFCSAGTPQDMIKPSISSDLPDLGTYIDNTHPEFPTKS